MTHIYFILYLFTALVGAHSNQDEIEELQLEILEKPVQKVLLGQPEKAICLIEPGNWYAPLTIPSFRFDRYFISDIPQLDLSKISQLRYKIENSRFLSNRKAFINKHLFPTHYFW